MKITDWRAYFQDRGVEDRVVDAYLPYIATLNKNKKPVVFEFEHLSRLLGVKMDVLARMVAAPESFYRKFSIPKRSGGKRYIVAPHRSLLACQRWIASQVLDTVTLHDAAHGFRKGRSIKTNAICHLGKSALLKMDLRDFFPSIKKSWVVNLFREMGYASNVAYYFASLCCYENELAQGAATSPMIANIVSAGLDRRLTRLSAKFGIVYTRYADDLTFSGDYIHHSFSGWVARIVADYGLSVNEEKTRLKLKAGSRIVTGISIERGVLAVPGEFKRRIKNEFFFIQKYGLLSHMSQLRISDPKYLYSLIGRVSYWLQIEPENKKAMEIKRVLSRMAV
ncbi:reverse transcriptase domain-containing protein [Achromobacter aegrifaciens]